ncbi:unnamed protein product [Adineta ricciae]|uniref:Ion transport domain-containing protein n=1 Tax=Adineta ricciae TaxID=249248 RepID=A0A815FZ71_ADIRI|nr:unnamed protein product [Adineta ricciae]
MCFSLCLWYVRILHLFVASEQLGIKLLMIFNTMKDLQFFVSFILIFLIGYAVTSYSLLTTKQQVIWDSTDGKSPSQTYQLAQNGTGLWNWTLVRNVIDWGMWKVYGQVSLLSNVEVDDVVLNADNDVYGTMVFILTIIFVCVANVLLLNVLVALFNVTLTKNDQNSHSSWAFHRFLLVDEYTRKSPLPPPLSLFYYAFKAAKHLYHKCQNKSNDSVHGSLDDTSGLDSNLYSVISFNAEDKIKVDGVINKVSINFSTSPTDESAKIWLFVIMAPTIRSNPNSFSIIRNYDLTADDSLIDVRKKLKTEIRTFKTDLRVEKGQYLAIRFSPGSGNPCSTERNQYYVNFDDKPYMGQTLLFTHCPTKGFAMSFNVQTAPHTVKRSQFQIRDDMLQEQSIAREYWVHIIKSIKEKEKEENKQHDLAENF